MRPVLLPAIAILAIAAVIVLAVTGGFSPRSGPSGEPGAGGTKVRQAAVAGMFYPAQAEELGKMIDDFLAAAKPPPVENVRALVCPHAGYVYSGAVAACAYKQLVGRDVDAVIVLAPTHYVGFKGAFVSDVEAYETPLGRAAVVPLAKELMKQGPFICEPPYRINRPGWWRQSPKDLPAFGQDKPDTWEHSLEVQVPFLQKVAPKAGIVPVTCGEMDPMEVAQALAGHLNDRTILVASSDLSHYLPYEEAKESDRGCISAVLRLSPGSVKGQDACGIGPIQTLVHLARQKGWKAKLLDYRNSGDTAGDKSAVVGYAAIAFYQPSQAESQPATAAGNEDDHTPEERKFLLELARRALTEAVVNRRLVSVDSSTIPDKLMERKGCFVTLNKEGKLRGCIGHIFPQKPLYRSVIENAVLSALKDTRFAPVQSAELADIQIEISVLTVPQRLPFSSPDDLLAKLRPRTDGVVLRVGAQQATYLPQVWEQIPGKTEFLGNLSQKAGLAPDAWKQQGVIIETYQDEAFRESGGK
jgi:hypothetical protein